MAPPSDGLRLLEIPPEVRNLVLQKMDANRFIPMYKTCSSMAASVDCCLKSMKNNDFLISHISSLSLQNNAVYVTVIGNCSIRLPVSTLDSFIWRFVTRDNVNIENDSSATKYLEKLANRDYILEYLWIKRCSSGIVANALRILKPRKTQIKSFRGQLSDILPVLPFSTWRKTRIGCVECPSTLAISDHILSHLGDFEVLKCFSFRDNEKLFGLKDLRTRRYVIVACERRLVSYMDVCGEEDDESVEKFCITFGRDRYLPL